MVIVYAVVPTVIALVAAGIGFYMYKQRVAARELQGTKGINSIKAMDTSAIE